MSKPSNIRRFDEINWAQWSPDEHATILFVIRAESILLIRKKRGLGAGKINGPGGRVEPGETPQDCAIREIGEELAVEPIEPIRQIGELLFQFADGYKLHVHVFRADDCKGRPTESDEAIPLWTPLDDIPYDEMWADDKIWIPLLLEEVPFVGRFLFRGDAMLGYDLIANKPN